MANSAQNPDSPAQEAAAAKKGASRTLSDTELQMIENWVKLADDIGFPRSLSQIYGFVFISRRPVTAQECVDALKISRSSAGQGLKALRDAGAIRPAFELGARREAFVIEPDLGVLLKSIVERKVMPAFDTFFNELERLEQTLNDGGQQEFLVGRIQKLERWRSKLTRAQKWLLL